MNHCPICWTHRKLRSFKGEIRWWWTYKVKKEPEPSVQEIMASIIPATFTALLGMKLGQEIQEEYEKVFKKAK